MRVWVPSSPVIPGGSLHKAITQKRKISNTITFLSYIHVERLYMPYSFGIIPNELESKKEKKKKRKKEEEEQNGYFYAQNSWQWETIAKAWKHFNTRMVKCCCFWMICSTLLWLLQSCSYTLMWSRIPKKPYRKQAQGLKKTLTVYLDMATMSENFNFWVLQ